MTTKSWETLKAENDAREIKERLDRLVPDERTAVDIVFAELYRRKLVRCQRCKSERVMRHPGERDLYCLQCRKTGWFTANTFFHQAKRLKPWLFFYALAHKGIILSSSAFARIGGIASSAAWRIFKKAERAILDLKAKDAPVISTGAFLAVICKRSRLTPAGKHPAAEQEEMDRNEKQDVDEEKLSPKERTTLNSLDYEPVSFDSLREKTSLETKDLSSSLIMLEIKGLAQALPGDAWKRSKQTKSTAGEEATAYLCTNFLIFVRKFFHGISRKYAQPYLVSFWRYRDKARWDGRAVLQACLKFGKIDIQQILSYVSPELVSFMRD